MNKLNNEVSMFFAGALVMLLVIVGSVFAYSDYKYPAEDPKPYRFTIEALEGNLIHFYTEVPPGSTDEAVLHQLAILLLLDTDGNTVRRRCSYMLAQFDHWGENTKFSFWDVDAGESVMCGSFLV